jgi:hypothetical protein
MENEDEWFDANSGTVTKIPDSQWSYRLWFMEWIDFNGDNSYKEKNGELNAAG